MEFFINLDRDVYFKGYNKRIDRRQGRSLSLILNDYESLFYDMLSILNEKTIQRDCINILLKEI